MTGALDGIKVADFGRFVAGPWCSCLLADLGADVVRVERVGGGEDRYVAPVADDGAGSLFLQVNRNKRGMTADPTSTGGREVVRRLVGWADVVVVNLPETALRIMGLDYDSVRAVKKDVILTTIDAFGRGGPYSDRVGFDGVGQAMSSSMHLSGQPGRPTKTYVPWVDFNTAALAAYATMAALLWRERTGEGQHVTASLLRTALTASSGPVIEQAVTQPNRTAIGNRSHYGAPYDVCATRDGWVIVQVITNPLFVRWCRLVGAEEWIGDPRFDTDEHRAANADVLCDRLGAWCAERTTADALAQLDAARIPAGPVLSPQQVLDDPHVQATGLLQPVDYPGLAGLAPVVATPVMLSKSPAEIRRSPPTPGQHTDEVLGHLGYAPDEITALRTEGAV